MVDAVGAHLQVLLLGTGLERLHGAVLRGKLVGGGIDGVVGGLRRLNLAGDEGHAVFLGGGGLVGDLHNEVADTLRVLKDEAAAHGAVDELLVQEAVAAVELPVHVALGLALLRVVAELLHSLLEGHLVAVEHGQHAVGQVLCLLLAAGGDVAANLVVEDVDDAGAEAVGTHGGGHHLGHHPLVADDGGLNHGAGLGGGDLLVQGALKLLALT